MAIRYFALIIGILFTLIGILGFVPGLVMLPAGAPELMVEHNYGYLFGLFPVNTFHNIIHLAIGIWGLVAYRNYENSKTFSRSLAIIYGVFAIMGLFPITNTFFGLVPMFSHDIWLHAVTALVAAYMGFSYERTHKPESGKPVFHS